MRCPKCHYLSFDPEPRCKNCGYDLEVADADLALHTAESDDDVEVPDLALHERPNADAAPVTLELVHAGASARSAGGESKRRGSRANRRPAESRLTLIEEPADQIYEEPARQLEPEPFEPEPQVPAAAEMAAPMATVAEPEPAHDFQSAPTGAPTPVSEPDPEPEPVRTPFRSAHTTEMPLFVKGIADSDLRTEVMSLPSEIEDVQEEMPVVPATLPPLAVRRTTIDSPRALAQPETQPQPQPRPQPKLERRLGPLDHDLLEDLKRVEREEAVRDRQVAGASVAASVDADDEAVAPGRRAGAAAIDVAVLGGIALFVFWATLRLCNVSVSAVGWAALIPFVIFIAVMDLSYLLMFTAAGGQTPGKMLMHLRVVGDDREPDAPVPLSRAAWRSALTMISVVALGLGWLPALFGKGLTLHDRLAHTRVVRV